MQKKLTSALIEEVKMSSIKFDIYTLYLFFSTKTFHKTCSSKHVYLFIVLFLQGFNG